VLSACPTIQGKSSSIRTHGGLNTELDVADLLTSKVFKIEGKLKQLKIAIKRMEEMGKSPQKGGGASLGPPNRKTEKKIGTIQARETRRYGRVQKNFNNKMDKKYVEHVWPEGGFGKKNQNKGKG